jgi:charged multivesicular body protein 4
MLISNDISDAIARPALGTELDEDEILEELEALEQEELDNKLVGVDVPSQRVPTVADRRTPPISRGPNSDVVEPAQKTKEDEDEEAELRALQAEMAI